MSKSTYIPARYNIIVIVLVLKRNSFFFLKTLTSNYNVLQEKKIQPLKLSSIKNEKKPREKDSELV